MTQIRENIARVQANIADACARAGRSTGDVTLVAVSKTHPPEAVLEAVEAGLQHFGENRVEESAHKLDRKSTRLNSSHVRISYAVFCLKKKRKQYALQRCETP